MYRQYLLDNNILAISDTNPHIFGDGSDLVTCLTEFYSWLQEIRRRKSFFAKKMSARQ